MYIPRPHRLEDHETIFGLIEQHPLATWVSRAGDGLDAHHIPFFLDRERGPLGTLIAHVARANPVWRQLEQDARALVIFRGPQAYISPGWYPGKAEHGKVVPTWNYAAVHAHGVARAIEDPGWLLDMLKRLSGTHEAGFASPWRVEDAPADYIDRMLRAIVGIEIPVDRFEARLKVSQDEDLADRAGTVQGLLRLGSDEACAMARLVEDALPRAS